ncbi:hypothetical protein C0992_007147, partial [Termitomyces sp. T32_za158]
SARGSAIDSPRSQRSVLQDPSTTPLAQQVISTPALHAADENAMNADSVVLGSGTAPQRPRISGSSGNTSSSTRFSRLGQLAKRAMGRNSTNDPRPLASARGLSPPAVSPAGSPSQTIHDTDPYEGTTVVNHDNFEALPIGSPIYVEPKLTNDYAKMESPRASIVSFNSYIHRFRQFFLELNDLPWVAERVTVDYIPGADRDRRRPRVLQRPISWYGNTPHSRRPSLFSDDSSPTSQPPQVQLPPRTSMQPPALYRSISAQQEFPPASLPQPDVSWEILDPANPSNAPYATVVPANWSLHQPIPLDHLESAIPIQPPQPGLYPPTEPQPTANHPQPTIPQQPASTWSYPGIPTDEYQQFVTVGETFPTGYVPYAHAESVEAAYQDRRIHPRHQDFAPQGSVPQQSVPSSAGTGAAQTVQDGFDMEAPQTARSMNEPFTTSSGQAGGASLPASSVRTPYDPIAQPPVVAPTPRQSWSAASAPGAVLANAETTARETVVSPESPRNPPSVAASRASRTTQRSQGRAPSVRTVQNVDRSPSVVPSHASRAPSRAASQTQAQSRPPSLAPSHVSRPPSVPSSHASRVQVQSDPNQTQARSRPPSRAPSHASRPPSVPAPAMTETPNRPPSAALSHASQARSARTSQSRPVSVAPSHARRTPSAGTRTPEPMRFPQPVIPPAA